MSFNQELFDKVAKEFALPETLKTAILGGEGLPDEFDFDENLTGYLGEREGFYKAKLKPTIVDEYKQTEGKAAYIATIKPIRNKIIKDFGLTEEEIKGSEDDVKALIALAKAKEEKARTEQGTKTSATMQAELTETKNKYAQLFADHTKLVDDHGAKINSIEAEKEATIRSFRVDQAFNSVLESDDFKWAHGISNVKKWLRLEMQQKGYKVDFDPTEKGLMIYSEDGSPAFTLDGRDQYKELKTAISDFGNELNLFVRSNGDNGGNTPAASATVNGKKANRASVKWLQQQTA